MTPEIIFGFVSAAAVLVLILGRQNRSQQMRLVLGGIAVAAALIAVSLIAEKF